MAMLSDMLVHGSYTVQCVLKLCNSKSHNDRVIMTVVCDKSRDQFCVQVSLLNLVPFENYVI